MNKYIFWS